MPPRPNPNPPNKPANEAPDPFGNAELPDPFGEDGKTFSKITPPEPVYQTPGVQEAQAKMVQQFVSAYQAGVPFDRLEEIVYGTRAPKRKVGKIERFVNWDIIPDTIPFTRFLPGRGETNIGLPGPKTFRPIATAVLPTISTIQTLGRGIVSANEELIQQFKGPDQERVYKPTDYIPVHEITGLPIAKPGDTVISNWRDVVAFPVPGIEKAKNLEEAQAIQDKYVKEKARTDAGSWADVKRAMKDFSYSASDNPYVPETGNKYIDGIIDFSYDLILDPSTYPTFGGSAYVAPLKGGIAAIEEGTSKAVAAATRREAARVAAREAADEAARIAADVSATAAQKAAAQTAADVAEAAAEKAYRQAAALAPRRTYGRVAREALASDALSARVAAQEVIDDVASTAAQKAVAQDTVKVLTDEVIQNIAAKGYSILNDEASKILGVRPGLRIGLPGFGPQITVPSLTKAALDKFGSPYVARLSQIAGQALSGTRLAVFQTLAGLRQLDNIIPPGVGSQFLSDSSIRSMRSALASKSVPANVAKDYVQLLAADKAARGQLDLIRKSSGALIAQVTRGREAAIMRDIAQHLRTPQSEWARVGLPALDATQQKVYDKVREVLNKFAAQANSKGAVVGAAPLGVLPDYFPRVQSREALEWAARNADEAKKAAGDLGVDRTFFLGNFTPRALGKDKIWFGTLLKGTETTDELNAIARPTLGFDFFETDPVTALVNYAENHARYMSWLEGLDKLLKISPAKAGGMAMDIKASPSVVTTLTARPGAVNMSLGNLDRTLNMFMNPDRLQLWNIDDVVKVRSELEALRTKLTGAGKLDVEAFDETVLALDEKINQINRLVDAGTVDPTMGSLLRTEIEDFSNALAQSINSARKEFLVTDPSRWQSVQRMILDGFTVLNQKTLPDIAVRNDILELWTGFKRLDDPGFVRLIEGLLKDYNTMFKSYATLTPGFHNRNALGMVFMTLAGNISPKNAGQALRLFMAYKGFMKRYEGKIVTTTTQPLTVPFTPAAAKSVVRYEDVVTAFLKFAKDNNYIKPGEFQTLNQSLGLSGATGYGQAGEIAAEAGVGRPGFFGREPTGRIPILNRLPAAGPLKFLEKVPGFKKPLPGMTREILPEVTVPSGVRMVGGMRVPFTGSNISQILGSPIYVNRSSAQWIEELGRFTMMWDGLKKGLSPEQAAARVQKYLVDYNDLSLADRAIKQINPFWTWASRNAVLQIENMWMNPKAYSIYGKLRTNLEDEEETSPFLREYQREAGAFKLPGTDVYLRPDFGFPGAGQPGLIQEFIQDPERLLGRLSPLIKTYPEIRENKQFFSGTPITNEMSAEAEFNKWMYALRQVNAPMPLIARYANMTTLDKYEFMKKVFGTKQAVGEEQADRNRRINAFNSVFGLPGFIYTPEQEAKDIWAVYFQLLEETKTAQYRKGEAERKMIKEAEKTQGTLAPGEIPNPFGD